MRHATSVSGSAGVVETLWHWLHAQAVCCSTCSAWSDVWLQGACLLHHVGMRHTGRMHICVAKMVFINQQVASRGEHVVMLGCRVGARLKAACRWQGHLGAPRAQCPSCDSVRCCHCCCACGYINSRFSKSGLVVEAVVPTFLATLQAITPPAGRLESSSTWLHSTTTTLCRSS